ncbi:glycoside hydrolase family protein [Paenibacillus sp. 2KB_20]|uniref:glycoside hydrolase family protein n=1 Tax=Paenibacillus sp. 2KB_20 TaxID=3232977 RepID=UPI003F9938F3
MSRKISQAGVKLIKDFEGCRLTAYKPVSTEKYWTIGWGHYGPDVKVGMTITQAQADSMLIADLAKYEAYVNNEAYAPVTAKLNQNQFDALVSFCYNCGAGNLKKLCAGRTIEQIAQNITAYNKAGGKVLNGLVRRRQAELELFNQSGKEAEPVSDKVNVIVNGKKIKDGKLENGVTYVPLRAVGEALGAKIGWDKGTKTATLDMKV